jgi:thymidylate kinase
MSGKIPINMQSKRGRLVVIDGPGGSGKDSLIGKLTAEFSSRGEPFFLLSEDDLDKNRNEILAARERGKSLGGSGDKEMAEALVRHRADIYRRFAYPRLDDGCFVIANRGEPATLAYQTARSELTMEDIWEMHRNAGIQIPDLVVLTSCDAETALQREQIDKITSVRGEREAGRGLSGKVTQEIGASMEEQLKRRETIHHQYEVVREFLEVQRVPVLLLDTESMTVPEEVDVVLSHISRQEKLKI